MQALAARRDPALVDALVSALREGHRNFSVLSSALQLLSMTGVNLTSALIDLLHHPEADLRIQAALALGTQHNRPAAVEALLAALEDEDANVRFHAIEALGSLGAGAALDRRTRNTRDARAMRSRSAFGRELVAAHWARAEFDALTMLHQLGAAVPYPAQVVGTEILLEFVGAEDGAPAPRLAEITTRGPALAGLWEQAIELMVGLAGSGYAHGDLSAFNLLVHGERLVMIDLPQLVDVIANPQGPFFLDRDASTVAGWFVSRGFPIDTADLIRLLRDEARIP